MKKKILCWSDSTTAGTGFGTVSKYILHALHATGEYEIHHLAINFHGDFFDNNKVPWQVQPAKVLNPKDVHGIQMFQKMIQKHNYDIVWMLNDLHVMHYVKDTINIARHKAISKGRKPPVFICYYPVDAGVHEEHAKILPLCDIPVCYTDYGREETLKVIPEIKDKLVQIPHGIDIKAFHPLPKEPIDKWRREHLGAKPEKTVVININRNNTRKQLPYTLLAFKEFKKQHPDSVLYMHTLVNDQGGNLDIPISKLGLSKNKDVILPQNYSLADPFPVEILNNIYNAGDIFLTTHLGEGWGLTISDALAVGTPVVAPYNTCMPELLGENSERGYLYPCHDEICIDNSGYRRKGLIPDIVSKMNEVLTDKDKEKKKQLAIEWAHKHSWDLVTEKWVELFNNATIDKKSHNNILAEDV